MFDLNHILDGEFTPLPVDEFCVRKPAAVFAENRYWIYADVIPWNNPYWPDTYDTSIHAFSSPDCREWEYHGEVVGHGALGEWDFGGVATPGAITFNGKIIIFYSGREMKDGKGERQIGMVVAEHPQGPFRKIDSPAVSADHPASHLDDPIPVLMPDGETIRLYYRQADHHKPQPSNYRIKMRESRDGGASWSEAVDVVVTDGDPVRATETAEVAIIDGETRLFTFDHFTDGTCQTVLRTSRDGVSFQKEGRRLDALFSKRFKRPVSGGGFQVVFLPEENGEIKHIGISEETDEHGHYTLNIGCC